jgi:hypothetical protein
MCAVPGPFAVWHDAQLFCRIGRTSLENDTVFSTVVGVVVAAAVVAVVADADVGAVVLEVVLDVDVDFDAHAATRTTNTTDRTFSGTRRRMPTTLQSPTEMRISRQDERESPALWTLRPIGWCSSART